MTEERTSSVLISIDHRNVTLRNILREELRKQSTSEKTAYVIIIERLLESGEFRTTDLRRIEGIGATSDETDPPHPRDALRKVEELFT